MPPTRFRLAERGAMVSAILLVFTVGPPPQSAVFPVFARSRQATIGHAEMS
jgi:hypothetical protein